MNTRWATQEESAIHSLVANTLSLYDQMRKAPDTSTGREILHNLAKLHEIEGLTEWGQNLKKHTEQMMEVAMSFLASVTHLQKQIEDAVTAEAQRLCEAYSMTYLRLEEAEWDDDASLVLRYEAGEACPFGDDECDVYMIENIPQDLKEFCDWVQGNIQVERVWWEKTK